jgi:hypothetical protein
MTVTEQDPGGWAWFQQRVKNILFSPAEEWDRIEAEPATVRDLYLRYACILAAIGPVARLIGGQVFGRRGFFLIVHPPLIRSLLSAVVDYGLNLAGIFVLALAIDAMAPSFGGTRSRIQALKLAVYAWTAGWLFAVFQLAPPVSGLSIIGIYSLYLLYLGLPKLMKPAEDKAMVYAVISIVVALAIWIVVTLLATSLVVAAPLSASV